MDIYNLGNNNERIILKAGFDIHITARPKASTETLEFSRKIEPSFFEEASRITRKIFSFGLYQEPEREDVYVIHKLAGRTTFSKMEIMSLAPLELGKKFDVVDGTIIYFGVMPVCQSEVNYYECSIDCVSVNAENKIE